ncbi:transmembrane protein 79-like [Conger conger]|uniref:transmembrane protein 79-like n=1 Tax=Conger conger TaxID=82655 RepID=UPI002A5A3272|nr:transmembrane protein 79-like [Conger conger]XP_061111451.1 transmembrane protein 79-like [Conger conger]
MAEPQTPGRYQPGAEEEEPVSSARLEPSTLQWPGDKKMMKEGEKGGVAAEKKGPEEGIGSQAEREKGSAESMSSSQRGPGSRTESELGERGSRLEGGWTELEKAKKAKAKEAEAETNVKGALDRFMIAEDGDTANWMPEKAAQVFSPTVTIIRPSRKHKSATECPTLRADDLEKDPLIRPQGTPPDAYYDWSTGSNASKCSCFNRGILKLGGAILAAAVIFPFLVWGGYALLPFDAPVLTSAPYRLVYTLRCSIFAAVPIVLGVLVLGVSRLRFSSSKPLYEGGAQNREVSVHWRYVSDSVSLFLLYFLQLAVMATYVSQDHLKLVPLLTIVFAFGRLVYWVSVALKSPVRGLGFGLSFLPILPMLGANLYFIFALEGGGGILALEPPATPGPPRMRMWG